MPETYIITPNYNGRRFLRNYFESLLKQTYTDFKIIFIDNSEDNSSFDFIKENFNLQLIEGKINYIKNPQNYGFARSNNLGIKEALKDKRCEYIICLNNDTKVLPIFLEEIINCAKRHPDAGSIQAKMIWGKNTKLIDSVGLEYSKNGLGFNRGAYEHFEGYNKEEEIFGCSAGACLCRKEALQDIRIKKDYFDEDFFAYYEDFDLALRLRWAGWSAWYCPEAVVYHYKGGTGGIISDFTIYHSWRNHTWTIIKNLPQNYIIRHLHLIILSELMQIGISLFRKKPIIIKSKIDAYKNISKFSKKEKKIKKRIDINELEKWFILKWKIKIPKEIY